MSLFVDSYSLPFVSYFIVVCLRGHSDGHFWLSIAHQIFTTSLRLLTFIVPSWFLLLLEFKIGLGSSSLYRQESKFKQDQKFHLGPAMLAYSGCRHLACFCPAMPCRWSKFSIFCSDRSCLEIRWTPRTFYVYPISVADRRAEDILSSRKSIDRSSR